MRRIMEWFCVALCAAALAAIVAPGAFLPRQLCDNPTALPWQLCPPPPPHIERETTAGFR
jgi:hypothetical protein